MRSSQRSWLVGLVAVACVGGPSEPKTPPPVSPAPVSTPDYTPPPPGTQVAEPPTGTQYAEPPPPEPLANPVLAQGGPIHTALGAVPSAVAANYVFALSADRSQLTIDPRPQPSRRAARDIRGGFEAVDSKNGGKILTLVGGPFKSGRWVRASFREQVKAEAQLAELRRSSYDVEQVRDLLVVEGERDSTPTVFAFSADARKPGIVGICSEVTIVDFGKDNFRPVAVRKPVIYLYPERATDVRVDVEIDGEFIAVYPPMGVDGWDVRARPDGALIDRATGRRHRYLFWEGTSAGFEIDPKEAHCVAAADTAGFLERACGRFALTDEECGDFVTYWLPALNRSPYNVIQFVDEGTYGRYARMRVEPRPDTVVRQFMIFRGSREPVAVGAPELPQRARRGFTVVEWGGAEIGAGATGQIEIR